MHILNSLKRANRLFICFGNLVVYKVELKLLVLPYKYGLGEINDILGLRFLVKVLGFLFHSGF